MAYLKDNIDENIKKYYNTIKDKYGSRILEFDPQTIENFLSYFNREGELKKLLGKKAPLERCDVFGTVFPIICSPSFINQLGFQVQRKIEQAMGFKDIHKLGLICIRFSPFFSNNNFYDDETFYFNETMNGISYSYFQYTASLFSSYPHDISSALLWVRFYSPTNPERIIRPDEEVDENTIRFEICDTVPASFPAYQDLPEHALRIIEEGRRHNIDFETGYEKRTYNPNYWKIEFKQFLDIAVEKNRRAEARAARRKSKPKPEVQKIPVDIPAELIYFPDLTFTLTFSREVTNDIVEEVEDIMRQLNDRLCEDEGNGFEFLDVEKNGETNCAISIDFGRSPPTTIYRIVDTLEKSGLDIVKILIE